MSDPAASVSMQREQLVDHSTILIQGTPIAKARARSTRSGHHYTPAKTKQAEQQVRTQWIAQSKPRAPHGGPIHLRVQFQFQPAQSWPKWKQELARSGQLPHTSKPDVDNLLKLIQDALNGLAWIDDSQVISVSATKRYGPESLTRIMISYNTPPR